MAVTTLADAVVPAVFTSYMLEETLVKADVFKSGIVRMDSQMSTLMSGGGRMFNHPFWNDLDNTEAGIGSDNPAQIATPGKIGADKMQFVRQFRTRGWSSAQLVAELAGDDPQRRIVSRIAEYWARQFNLYTIGTLTGIFNSNITNDGGDMVLDISAKTGTTVVGGVSTPAYMLNADAIIEAKQTMGDASSGLKILLMHSRLKSNLQKQNLIQYIPNSRGEISIPTYLGYEVVESDTMPIKTVGPDVLYTTYLTAPGVLGFSENPPAKPVETFYWPAQGNGAGVEEIWTRRQFGLHPYGFNWTDASCAAQFPTVAEMASAANWQRKYPERKQVPMVAIISKNG